MNNRAIIIHSLEHARAALAAAAEWQTPVTVLSAPGAAAYAGAAWFRKVVDQALAEHRDMARGQVTAVLDCGDAPGLALGALRQGIKAIRFTGSPENARKIAAIAGALGAVLCDDDLHKDALDLKDASDCLKACREWLQKGKGDGEGRAEGNAAKGNKPGGGQRC